MNDIIGCYRGGSTYFNKGIAKVKDDSMIVYSLASEERHVLVTTRLDRKGKIKITNKDAIPFKYRYNPDSGILFLTFKNIATPNPDKVCAFQFFIEEEK